MTRLAVIVALAALALAGSALGKAPAADSGPAVGPRMLPMLELGREAGRKARPPAGVSNASLLLERGVFRPLPDVPGALETTHLRNNNRGGIVGELGREAGRKPGSTYRARRSRSRSGSTTAARWWAAGSAGTRRSTP